MIERQTSHLIRLVDDLLDVARITRGKIELRRQQIDLKTSIQHAVETSTPLIDAKQQKINVALPKEALTVDGDPIRLSQVFANLINNASKFTPAKGHIKVATQREGEDVIVSVSDDGMGFTPGSLAHAFDLFNQGDQKPGQGQNGIGVGLALARSLIELHGGTLEAESAGVGKGSTFQVRLRSSGLRPLVQDGQSQLPSSPRALPHRVLIVDDKQDISEGLAMLVRSLGGEAHTEQDAPSAIAALASFKPDIAIMDIGLPGMDGCELAGRIRKLPEGQDIILAALSGWGQEETRQRAVQAGFDHYFVKPMDVDTLQKLLASPPGGKT